MLTTRKNKDFARARAEVPHSRVANALTAADATSHRVLAKPQCAAEAPVTPDPTDALVTAAKAGDRAAFDQLLALQRPRAMAAALRVLHNPDDAEDAVQEAFLKIWRSLPSFEGRSSFSTWVHRIVTNASLDLMRKSAARAETVEHPDLKADPAVTAAEPRSDVTPESELAEREVEKLVRLAVATLPAAHRQAVLLREFDDCSYQEMAEIIACPIGTVMSRLHHARGKLAEELRAPLAEALAA
jgi:RNA polymerase sigma-70 factor (ECF subfamily)